MTRARIAIVAPSLVALAVASVLMLVASRSQSHRSSSTGGTPRGLAAYLVSQADVDRSPADSPERALKVWWRSIQYENVDDAYSGLTQRIRRSRTLDRFASDVRSARIGFFSKPDVTGRTVRGGRVRVHVNIVYFRNDQPYAMAPRGFSLVAEESQWQVDDLAYLDVKAREGRQAAAALKRAHGD